MKKRILTGLLALSVCMTTVLAEVPVYGAAAGTQAEAASESAEESDAAEGGQSAGNADAAENETAGNTGNVGSTELTDDTELADGTETAGTGENAGDTESTGETETAGTAGTAENAEITDETENGRTADAAENAEITDVTEDTAENAESTENTEAAETTETTEAAEAAETSEIEALEEETEMKSEETAAGSSYDEAVELAFDTTIVSSGKLAEAGWYQFTLEKDGMVSFTFAHDKLSVTRDTAAWSIEFAAEKPVIDTTLGGIAGIGGISTNEKLYTLSSNAYDTTNVSPAVGLPAGTYRIKITPVIEAAGGTPYSLRLSYSDVYCETEDNNSSSAADELPLDKEITGSLYGIADTDYYKVTVTEDGYVNIRLTHDKVSGKESVNLYHISFYDMSNNLLYEAYSNGSETELNSINIGAVKGSYLVKVEGGVSSAVDPYTGNYGLKVTATANSNWEKESNDTVSVANAVTPGVTYGGDIRSTSDVDYYTYTSTGKGYLGLDFSHTVISGWETLSVYKITVTRKGAAGEVYSGYVKGGDATWKMPNLGLPADTYYIKIEAAATLNTSILNGSLDTCYPADYSITVNWTNTSKWEEEVNDTLTTANELESGKTIGGSIATTSDKDYYKVTMKKNGYLSVKLSHENTGSTANHYQMAVLNQDGSELYKTTNAGVDTTCNSGKIGLEKGTYYVLISASSTLYTGDYKLKVTAKSASNWESEVNGDTATADKIKVGKEMNGIISSYSGDLDYYKFTLDKATYVNVSLTHEKMNAAGRSWYVYLLKADGSRLSYKKTDHLYAYAGDVYTETDAVKLAKGTYYVVVRAAADNKNAVGQEYQVCVNKISAKKTTISGVKSAGCNKLKVTWKAVPGAVSYEVYRSTSKNGSYSLVKTIDEVKTVSWTDKNVVTGKTYYYKVKATVALEGDATKTGSLSKAKSGKAVPASTTLKAKAGTKQIKLTWSKVSGASGYELYRSTTEDGKYSKIKTITKGSTKSYTDKSKVSSGKTYYYKIRAYRKVDGKKVYGGYSKVISKKAK